MQPGGCLADPPNVAAAAYHCQQAAEKLIKAVLVILGSRQHDNGALSLLFVTSR